MPGVDGRTVCLAAEGESTRDGRCITKNGADRAVIMYSSHISANTTSQWLTVFSDRVCLR